MSRRRTRSAPTVTELRRVEQVLEREPAIRVRLGAKTSPVRKRDGEIVHFAAETVKVAQALRTRQLSPERAHIHVVLAVALEALGLVAQEEADDEDERD